MTAFTKENAARGADLGGIEGDLPGGRIKSNSTAPATTAQHSRRPDHYRLQVPPAWEVPGADAARLLARLWNVRRRS